MRRRIRVGLAVILLAGLMARGVEAVPVFVTDGTWTPMPTPCECGDTKYAGWSADGPNFNAGYVMSDIFGGDISALEYLTGESFVTMTEWNATRIFAKTDYDGATLAGSPSGVLSYTDNRGPVFYSNAPSGGAAFFAWFRWRESPTRFRLFAAINDTWPWDGDGNDGIEEMIFDPTLVCLTCREDPPPSVPEPGQLALLGFGLALCARQYRRHVR